MATLANLSIGLSADSARLKRDLDRARGHSKKWAAGQKREFAAVAASVKLIGAAVAGISFAAFIRGAVQTSQELRIMANLTGVSTNELQRVAPSLSRAGISLEKYSDILKDVNDKTHDFLQTGGGPMADFFENIAPLVGVTEDAFKGLSGQDALGLYVSSLEAAGLSTEQMTFYMEALASDSTMLLPLLRNNAAGMNEFALAAHEVLNPQTISALDSMGGAFSALGTVVTNITLNAFAPLIQFTADTLEGFRQLVSDFPALLGGLGLLAGAVTAVTLAMWANPVTIWAAALSAIVVGIAYAYNKFKQLSSAVGGAGEVFAILKDAAAFEFNKIGLIMERLKLNMQLAFNSLNDRWSETLFKMQMNFAQFADSIAETRFGEMVGMEGGNADAAELANRPARAQRTNEFVRLLGALQLNSEALNATNPHMQRMAEALAGEDPLLVELDGSQLPDLTNGGNGGGPDTPAAKSFYESTAEQFVSGLKSSFTTALATGDWKGFLDSVLDSFTMGIIGSFTEGLFKPFQDTLTDWMGSLFEGLGDLGGKSGGGLGGLFSAIGSIFGFAEGGIVPTTSTSKSYADSVPALLQPGELVVPKSQVDNFMSGIGGSGSKQTFNINVTGDVSRATRSEIVRMMPEIAAGTNMINRENGGR